MSYGTRNRALEWAKFIIWKMGVWIGIAQPMAAGIFGAVFLYASWNVVFFADTYLLENPIFVRLIQDAGFQPEKVIRIIVWVVTTIGTFFGMCMYARLAIICYPKIFDRYRIQLK